MVVEETRRNVLHLRRSDEVRAVDARLVAVVTRVGLIHVFRYNSIHVCVFARKISNSSNV